MAQFEYVFFNSIQTKNNVYYFACLFRLFQIENPKISIYLLLVLTNIILILIKGTGILAFAYLFYTTIKIFE